jgi:20S proteasome subunit beta 6
VALAGDDFCIVAADSRLSSGYSIMSRTTSKVSQLTDKCCIASSGCNADQVTLHKLLKFRIKMYGHQHEKQMSTPAIGQMLSTTLYGRRFFPYYTFNVVGGLDEKGEGCVFSYDAIGCIERLKYAATGTGSALIEPFLDNMVAYKNTDLKPTVPRLVVVVANVYLQKCLYASARFQLRFRTRYFG